MIKFDDYEKLFTQYNELEKQHRELKLQYEDSLSLIEQKDKETRVLVENQTKKHLEEIHHLKKYVAKQSGKKTKLLFQTVEREKE
jgi:hypothetical protein